MPLVSVHIITYNQKLFLRETIESVLMQDYENIEIIIADDCSTDGTVELIEEYISNFPSKIKASFSIENSGITSNSNKGLQICNGKYIAFLGGDDLMLQGKISSQVETLEANPNVVLCYHDLDVFDSSSGARMHLLSSVAKPREGCFKVLLRYGCFIGASSAMIRASNNITYFDNRTPIASDWLFWIRILQDGGRINYIPKVLGKYRRHDNNVTGKVSVVSNSSLQDHFITCAILKSEFPDLVSDILKRESELLRICARYEKYKKNSYLIASLKINLNFKTLLDFIL